MGGLLLFEFGFEAIDSKHYSTSSSMVVVASKIPFHRPLKINVILIFMYHSL
jgi:hypothetical protein